MDNELLFLIRKYTGTLIEQTKTKQQERFEFKLNEQVEVFSFSPPVNLYDEGKWLVAVTYFGETNSVFNKTGENNSFSTNMPGFWRFVNYLEDGVLEKLKKLLKLRSQKDSELHVAEVKKEVIK